MKQSVARGKKTFTWLIPVAAALGMLLALISAGSPRDIVEAVEQLGTGYILEFAAAANALIVIP